MSSILKRSVNSLRLGDLLVQAGLLTQQQMAEAVRTSRNKRMQIGQVLVMTGLLSPRDLQSALEAQSMLRDKSVELNEALRCLKIAYKVGVPFKDILTEYTSPKRSQTSKLGELLVESGLITYEVLARAVEQSYATGLPLGRMLVLQKTITNEVLTTALDLQVRVRDDMLSRAEAIATLRSQAGLAPLAPGEVAAEPVKAPLPHQDAPRKKGVRLGELMVMASVLTETDVMNALEWGLVNQQTIGQVLISQKLVSQSLLDAALDLQKLVDTDVLEPLKASEALARVHSGVSLEEAVADVKSEKESAARTLSYEKLLMLARVVGESEIDEAFDVSTKSAAVLGKIMVLTGHMDVPTLQATLRCYQLLTRGLLSQDDAVVTLDYALHHITGVLKFDDALKQLGWSKDRGLRLKGEPSEGSSETAPPPKPNVEVTIVGTDQITAGSGADSGGATIGVVAIQTDFSSDGEAAPDDEPGEQGSMSFHVRDDERLTFTGEADTQTSDNISALSDADTKKASQSDAIGEAPLASDSAVESEAVEGAAAAVSSGEGARPAKPTKHSQTIQPEDARATRLAAMMKNSVKAADNDLLVNFDPSADPPDALHRVFERLAHSYFTQQNYEKAQVLYERILVHRLNHFGPNDSALVVDLNNLAGVLVAQEKHNQAEPFMRRAVAILESSTLSDPLKVAECLALLANVYLKQEKLKEAEPLFKRSLEIRKSRLEPGHADIAQTLADYAKLLRRLKREDEAEAMYQEAIGMMARMETSTGQFSALEDANEDLPNEDSGSEN
ncbi:MAG: tetratricopeptide repeat protein [Cyanobacteria bacterium REEB67]|nr:tetratricopeptide repeat protein [Cyanobacteria bacterium REEB67]